MKNLVKKYVLSSLMLCGMGLLISACGGKNEPAATTTGETAQPEVAGSTTVSLNAVQLKTVGIQVGKVEMRNISGVVKVNGMLDVPPQNMASVSSPVEGVVNMTNLMQGSRVNRGQLLATIRNPDLIQMQQDYLQTQQENADNLIQLEYLEAEYKRQQELARENVNAGKTVQQAKAQYEGMKARIEGLKARIGGLSAKLRLIGISTDNLRPDNYRSQINIVAPVNGFITEVNVNNGKRVTPTDVLFEITGTEILLAKLNVFEKDLPKIRPGQTVRLSLANDAHEYPGKVLQIGKEIGSDRTVPVFCTVSNLSSVLPGAYLQALIETGGSNVPALPEAAVISFEGKDFIFLAGTEKEGTRQFTLVEVTKGLAENGFVEIILPTGMDDKAPVVVKGGFDLLAKMKNGAEE